MTGLVPGDILIFDVECLASLQRYITRWRRREGIKSVHRTFFFLIYPLMRSQIKPFSINIGQTMAQMPPLLLATERCSTDTDNIADNCHYLLVPAGSFPLCWLPFSEVRERTMSPSGQLRAIWQAVHLPRHKRESFSLKMASQQ